MADRQRNETQPRPNRDGQGDICKFNKKKKKQRERYCVMIPKPMHDFKLGFIAAYVSFFGCIKPWASTKRDQHVENGAKQIGHWC